MLRSSSEAWLPFLKAIRAPTDLPSCHFMPSFEKACNIFTPLPAASCCMYPVSVACLGSLLYMTCSKYSWYFAPDWMASRQTGLKSCNHQHPSKFGLQQIVTRPKIPHAYQAYQSALHKIASPLVHGKQPVSTSTLHQVSFMSYANASASPICSLLHAVSATAWLQSHKICISHGKSLPQHSLPWLLFAHHCLHRKQSPMHIVSSVPPVAYLILFHAALL